MNSTKGDLKWSLGGYGVYMISQMCIIVAIARLCPTEDLGRYGLAISICSIVILLFNLGLRSSHSTDVKSVGRMGVYVSTRISSSLAAFIIILLTSAAIFFDDLSTIYVIWLVAYSKSIETLSDLFYGSFQKFRRVDLMAASLSIRGPLTAIIFISLLWVSGNLFIALFAQAAVWSIVAIAFDVRMANRLENCSPRFERSEMLMLVKEALPLGTANFLSEIGTSAPRIIVSKMLGLSAAGVFTAVGYILVLGTVFASSVSHAISNRLAREFWSPGHGRFFEMVAKISVAMFGIGFVGVAVCSLWSEHILRLSFGETYASYGTLLTLLASTLSLRMPIAALQTALIAQRRFYEFAKLRFYVALAIVSFSAVGAISEGLEGVAVALLLVSLVQLFFLVLLIRRPQNTRNSHT